MPAERLSRGRGTRVRVDGVDTGKISHLGLSYIFDMESEWPIPPGAEYVEGSAHVVPGHRKRERAARGARGLRGGAASDLVLPAHVDNGVSYTPPSFEFDLAVVSAEGAVDHAAVRRLQRLGARLSGRRPAHDVRADAEGLSRRRDPGRIRTALPLDASRATIGAFTGLPS